MRFGNDEEDDYVVICAFSDANASPGPEWLSLQRKKYKTGIGETAQTKATAFINDNPVLKHLVYQTGKSRDDNRFSINYDVREKVFVIRLIPSFEKLVTYDEIKDDDYGIYRLIGENGETVYIGKGHIKQRLRQHKNDKNFAKIEVSFVKDEEKQLEYESFHLNRYRKKYGRLPMYNAISGHDLNKKL